MSKEKIKDKILKDGKEIYLSAQEYALLTVQEKKDLRTVLADEGIDADEYESNMKKLWPREVTLKPLTWRKK
jgi:hypothetical protein